MDEAFVGPKPQFQHAKVRAANKGKTFVNKKIVLGMVQRDGDLRLTRIPNRALKVIIPLAIANIARGSKVYTDESSSYSWMQTDYGHNLVNHSLGEYVRDDVTTNSIEGVFSHFKRTVVGTYHKISDQHLDRYLQMFAYRWNSRSRGKGATKIVVREDKRVNDLLRSTKGRRLTYKALIQKPDQ